MCFMLSWIVSVDANEKVLEHELRSFSNSVDRLEDFLDVATRRDLSWGNWKHYPQVLANVGFKTFLVIKEDPVRKKSTNQMHLQDFSHCLSS